MKSRDRNMYFSTILSDYLNSATIHGLVYIASGKNNWTRTAWTVAISSSVLMAGFIIADSFKSWTASPTVTSVETFPISEVKFPEVTICPPHGANTALNYDLRAARNVTLDKATRSELIETVKRLAHETYIDHHIAEIRTFLKTEDVRKIYEGQMEMADLFIDGAWYLKYQSRVTGMSGETSTRYLGEPYNPHKYVKKIKFYYQIVVPTIHAHIGKPLGQKMFKSICFVSEKLL